MINIEHTREEVIEAFSNALSVSDAAKKLGFSENNYRRVHSLAKYYNLEKPTYQASAINSAKAITLPLEAILVKDSHYSTGNLKKRLIQAGHLIYMCEKCSLDPDTSLTWKDITLQLDHINGDSADNRLENLRILCPNCHSQTETYARGNKKSYKNGKTGRCQKCKRKSPNDTICWRCNDSRIEFPGIETIFLMLQHLTVEEIASKLGVTEDALKRKMMGYASNLVGIFGNNQSIQTRREDFHLINNGTEGKKRITVIYPPIPELLLEIQESSVLTVAKRLGVSDNAVRRHIRTRAGEDAVPRGYAKNPKKAPLTKAQEFLLVADVNEVLREIESNDSSLKIYATKIHADPKRLNKWIDEKLGYHYIAPRKKAVENPLRGKIVYPPVADILSSIATTSYESTARGLGVSTKAIERHLRKHLPSESFPLSKSGILDGYRK